MLNELTVLNNIAEIMRPLSNGERRRIIAWLEDYYGIYDFEDDLAFIAEDYEDDGAEAQEAYDEPETAEPAPAEPVADTLEGFFAKVAPKTAIQKIVTAAWWLDTKQGKDAWKSFEVNKLLKSLDIKVSSVSGTLAIEAKKDDSMVVVLDKSTDSMQGRKTFRLSDTGRAFVEGRLA